MSGAQKEMWSSRLNTVLISVVGFLLISFYNEDKEHWKIVEQLQIELVIQKNEIKNLHAQLDVNDLHDAQLKKNYWKVLGFINRTDNLNQFLQEDN